MLHTLQIHSTKMELQIVSSIRLLTRIAALMVAMAIAGCGRSQLAATTSTPGDSSQTATEPTKFEPPTSQGTSLRQPPLSSTSPVTTTSPVTNTPGTKSWKQLEDERVARAKAQAIARANERVQKDNPDFGMTQTTLIDAIRRAYEQSPNILQFRRFLVDHYPELERAEWRGDEFRDVVPTTRPDDRQSGHLLINLMQGGHLIEVTYDTTTGALKTFQLINPQPARLRALPLSKGTQGTR